MQLGLSSFTFGWNVGVAHFPAPATPLGPLELLEIARENGVSLVQFGDNLPLHALETEVRAELLRHARASRITLETGARGLTAEHLRRYIALSHELGAPLLRFVIDAAPFEPSPAQVVQTLREALPELGELRVGIENHDRFPARVLARMIEELGDSRVGICLDTANSLGAGEGLGEVVPALAPHTLNWHIKDYKIARFPHQMGFTVEGRAAGNGDLDLDFVWQHLEKSGRCRSAVIELWTPPEPAHETTLQREREWAKQSLQNLRTWREWT